MTNSQNLLAEYRQTGSDAAFRELVSRYVDLVYSTALRLVDGDAHRAQDVAQTVFVNLSHKAQTLPADVSLGGWLHRDTCLAAGHVMRGERRRQSRERQAAEMNALQNHADADYSLVTPLLDEAINELGEADRTAILLRFFEQHDFRAVGQALGSNEDAARMRVNRALEKLEQFLKRRGVTTTAASLGLVLTTNAVQAAPVGLAVTISTAAALAGTTLATATTATAIKTIAMTTLQKTVITATLAIVAGVGIYEARQSSQLREQVQTLQQERAPIAEQIQLLLQSYDEATNRLAALRDDNERLNQNTADLLRLRGEINLLRRQAPDRSNLAALRSAHYGLTPEQMPPVTSPIVQDTAVAYASLIKKLASGQLTPPEQWHLQKAWPYLGRRFSEPAEFSHFQSEYLAAMLNITNKDTIWGIRKLLESAREEERKQPQLYFGGRMTDEEKQRSQLHIDIEAAREHWSTLDRKTANEISQLLTDDQRLGFTTGVNQVLDFDTRLKVAPGPLLTESPIEGLAPVEFYQSFFTTKTNISSRPAKMVEGL